MEIAALRPSQDRQILQSYGKGVFRVSDTQWQGAIIVFPTRTIAWGVTGIGDLSLEAFSPVGEAADPPIELLLIGTGQRMALLPAKLRADLRSLGLAIEIMDTGSACRTYNLLIGEERRVAAALLPVIE
jgi:uncharacterized protein